MNSSNITDGDINDLAALLRAAANDVGHDLEELIEARYESQDAHEAHDGGAASGWCPGRDASAEVTWRDADGREYREEFDDYDTMTTVLQIAGLCWSSSESGTTSGGNSWNDCGLVDFDNGDIGLDPFC